MLLCFARAEGADRRAAVFLPPVRAEIDSSSPFLRRSLTLPGGRTSSPHISNRHAAQGNNPFQAYSPQNDEMANYDEFKQKNAAYVSGFTKGGLAMPPARKACKHY